MCSCWNFPLKKNLVILIDQLILVSSQTQFFEIVSTKSVVKISFGKSFLRCME